LPEAVGVETWLALDQASEQAEHWDYLKPSQFVEETPLLRELAQAWQLDRRDNPLSLMQRINALIYESFEYVPKATQVDSPIDEALQARRGVCQDFTHIMLALARRFGIPARYVSGYLYHDDNADRSAADATHAWVEAGCRSWAGWVSIRPIIC
jgi:transglutaminase-like putative cysteine protease